MSESIGAKLRQTREQRHLTLEQVSETTKIRKHYLEALENDDLSAIPSTAQARGFLRLYADSLGLDMNALVPTPRPVEPPPAPEPPAASPDVPADSASQATSSSEADTSRPGGPARPSFLSNLRQRFTRKPSEESAESQKESETPDQNQNPKPEAFVPARVTEELPAQPEPLQEEAPQDESQEPKPTTTKDRTTRGATARPKRTSKIVRGTDEKKNVNG